MSSSSPLRCDDGDNRRMGGRPVTCHARGCHRETEDTATEIVHEDVETLRRFGAASLTVTFELREVEREMGSIGGPVPKSSTRRTDPHTSAAPLGGDDREMSAFYATQIDADVDASTAHIIGDIIARHVTNQSVGDRIAPAATELCGQLELIAMTSRNAVSGNRRLAERRSANTWIGTDTGSGDCGGLFR